MNYQETIEYLYSRLPVFHRIGNKAFNPKLINTQKFCEYLGNPQEKFKSIHIAGTNGKGSTSHFLSSILQEAGYKVGLYTSPHLKDFNERFKINGNPIEHEQIIHFIEKHKSFIEELNPSFFELSVALAFDYFANESVDYAIIEVGLGGRLDSTNVINPILSFITNISLDHTDILGETLPKIAFEKAGIIKNNTPVVISERQDEIDELFIDIANQQNASITFASDHYQLKNIRSENLIFEFDVYNSSGYLILRKQESGLIGVYQAKNIVGIIKVVEELKKLGLTISNSALSDGIKNVIKNTHLKGRFQILKKSPLLICDTGHNEDGIKEVLKQLSSIDPNFENTTFIIGFVKDKNIDKIVELFPSNATYIFCEAKLPRALDASILSKKANEILNVDGIVLKDVNDAISFALSKADENAIIFVGGSNFVVAEIDNL